MTSQNVSRRNRYRWADEAPGWAVLTAGAAGRRRWLRYWLSDTVSGLGDLVIHHVLRLCPIDVCSAVGGYLGRRTGRGSLARKSRRARNLLAEMRPDMDDAALDDAITGMWDCIGRTYTEFSVLERLGPAGRVAIEGSENLDLARAAGGPVLVVGVHLGNFELCAAMVAAAGLAPWSVYQPPHSRFRHAIARACRERAGLRLLPPGVRVAAAAMRVLKKGGCLCMGIDEHVNGRVYGPVLDRKLVPAGNIVFAARLALATGAVLVPVWCRRIGGAHFRVQFCAPVTLASAPGRRPSAATIGDAVTALDNVFRPILNDNLDQWFMLHEVTPDVDDG
ncbi:MAG: lysophospholipid acyltransferase family protein [Alphaproteobacteria bacterium]